MTNPWVADTPASPISQVRDWMAGRTEGGRQPLIDVSQAAPGYPPAPQLREHLASLDWTGAARYGPVLGQPELRAALADDISAVYRAPVRPEQTAVTAGANQAFCLAVNVLCRAGEQVILPLPYYFNHDMWLRIGGVEPVYLPAGDDMIPNAERAAELVTDRTRAVVLVTPNNPTGRVYPPQVIHDFARLAYNRGFHLILDETYRDFREETGPPHHLFTVPEWEGFLVHIHSFSKVFAITGLRVGGLAARPGLLAEVNKVADCLTICPNRIGQEAALYGLRHLGEWVEDNRRKMTERLEKFTAAVSSGPYRTASAGAYFAYLRHPHGEEAEGGATGAARRLFDDHSVLALGGDMFGPGQNSYLRLAFGNLDDQDIPELARRLRQSAL